MSLFNQKRALLLLLTDDGLLLLSWQKQALTWLQSFKDTPEDHENFSNIIQSYPAFPVIIVTDLIEESFRHDTIVHVSGSDKAALLKRKLDFVFRNTAYRLAKVTGRHQDGRRDDKILMSALTKPEMLDVWVNLLVQQKMAIQSITSIAHLMEPLTAMNKLDQEHYLLIISLENNNLRQTFLKMGKVLFSRLTGMATADLNVLGNDIYQETMQIRQYLERIKFLPYEGSMRVQVYTPHAEQTLLLEGRTTDSNRFEVIDVSAQSATLTTDTGEEKSGPVYYFLSRVLPKNKPENIYAPPAARKFYDLGVLSQGLYIAAAAIIVTVFAMNTPQVLDVMNKWNQHTVVTAQTRPLRELYSDLSQRFPETPIPSREMELVVKSYDTIKQQILSPVATLNMIGAALAVSPGLKLEQIIWRKEAKVPVAAENTTASRIATNNSTPTSFQGQVLQWGTLVTAQITGQAYSPDSFRDAQNQVVAFADALSANPGVSVFASKLPTDVRTDISVSTTVRDGEVRAPFTLDLTIERLSP